MRFASDMVARVIPKTDWQEPKPDDEDARFLAYAERLRAIQKETANGGDAKRALHAKQQIGVRATFIVLDDLPAHAKSGLFAEPKSYRAFLRFSNGAGRVQHDKAGDVRGLAIKVVGVPGKKVIPGLEDKLTQDFLLIRTRTMPFKNTHEFVEVVTAAAGSPALLLPRVIARVGFGRGLGLLKTIAGGLSAPRTSIATTPLYSPVPIRLGDYAVRFDLMPHLKEVGAALEAKSPGFIGEELASRLANEKVVFDFRVQFYVDKDKTPIDDPTREWSYEDSPPVTVARLEIDQVDLQSDDAKNISNRIEGMSFDPWHALVEHRPLGELMRARNVAYRLSTTERKASPEPDDAD